MKHASQQERIVAVLRQVRDGDHEIPEEYIRRHPTGDGLSAPLPQAHHVHIGVQRPHLGAADGRLRSEIDQAVREFSHFYRTLQQIAKESIEAQGQVALESLDKSTKQYAEVTLHALGYIGIRQDGAPNTRPRHD